MARKILSVPRRLLPSFRAGFLALAGILTAAAAGPVRHLGPDRARIPYQEPHVGAKRRLLAEINANRAAAGAPPVAYDLVGARAGDDFCREAAARGYAGHWDLAGRPPYLRWAEAGGVDYHAQNVAARSRTGGALTDSIEELLLESHRLMMGERPPDDPHRKTILDPVFTHVGIGVALVGGEFRMTEEFSRQVAEWIEVPEGPASAGRSATFAAKLPPRWNVASVEVAFEPPPAPMSAREIQRRTAYAYPSAVHSYRPLLPLGTTWSDGSRGDFAFSSGRLSMAVPLDHGPGSYYVFVFAGEGSLTGKKLSPVTAARIEAR